MAAFLIKGRDPSQLLQIAAAKSAKAWRKLYLSRFCHMQDKAVEQLPLPGIRWLLDESKARGILAAHKSSHGEILREADHVVSGDAQVPGFGVRPISFSVSSSTDRAEAYAQRLLWRFDFLRPLTRAVLISSAPKVYIEKLEQIISQWQSVHLGLWGRDTVDDSIRILNLIEMLSILKEYLSKETIQDVIKVVNNCAINIEINRTRTGNHLIYEGLALLAAGYAFAGLPRASVWKRLGRRILEKQIIRQVRPDGFNAELSLNYHLITGTNFLKGWLIAQAEGTARPEFYRQRLERMIAAAAFFRDKDGAFPALGDSDRMAGPSREEKEGRALAALGAETAGTSFEDVYFERDWLLAGSDFGIGEASLGEHEEVFGAGGYHILRKVAGPKIIFDAGPFGLRGASHHGHADSLSFEIHLASGKFWIDPGGFSYVDYPARAYARSTAAHNTMQVDTLNSSEVKEGFGFGRGAQASCLRSVELPSGYLMVGEHDGYAPIIHRRAIFLLPGSQLKLLILDRLEGSGSHKIEAFFHADNGWSAEVERESVLWQRGELRVIQIAEGSRALRTDIIVGRMEPAMQGWIAPAFGSYLPAPVLSIRAEGNLPFEMVNLVVEGAGSPADLRLDLKEGRAKIEKLDLAWQWVGAIPEISVGN